MGFIRRAPKASILAAVLPLPLWRGPGAQRSLARYQAMQFRPTALERAFELAKSGDYETVSDIRKKLNSEGYSADQVSGRTLQRQLRELIEAAR